MLLFDNHVQGPRAPGLHRLREPERAAARRTDIIHPARARSLCGLLLERARRSPRGRAYVHFDPAWQQWVESDWSETAAAVGRWQEALRGEKLAAGERVAIMLRNRPEWAFFDLAALGLGLVTVPLFVNDRPDHVAHMLRDSGAKLLLVESCEHLHALSPIATTLARLQRVLVLEPGDGTPADLSPFAGVADWLPPSGNAVDRCNDADDLATIVYTSGTTGPPKGVMLSHGALLANAYASLMRVPALPTDLFLSFLPLSHTLERTGGYVLPMMAGSAVAFSRSIPELAEDLQQVRPTVLIAVPRVFERVHARIRGSVAGAPAARRVLFGAAVRVGWRRFEHRQGRRRWSPDLLLAPVLDHLVGARIRARLGGHLRVVVCGGAPLNAGISRLFIALGVPILQGYGLTEAGPVISLNALDDNIPDSIGPPLDGVEVRLADDGELQVRSPGLMRGYWQRPEATAAAIDADGWLRTGDQARMAHGHLFITGRLKDIIVLANGEKVAPADLEQAIIADPLFSQVLIVGEGRPFLSALVVLEPAEEDRLATATPADSGAPDALAPTLEQRLLERINARFAAFPGYAKVLRVAVAHEPWSIEQGLMTPTMKLRRARIAQRHGDEVRRLYAGH